MGWNSSRDKCGYFIHIHMRRQNQLQTKFSIYGYGRILRIYVAFYVKYVGFMHNYNTALRIYVLSALYTYLAPI